MFCRQEGRAPSRPQEFCKSLIIYKFKHFSALVPWWLSSYQSSSMVASQMGNNFHIDPHIAQLPVPPGVDDI